MSGTQKVVPGTHFVVSGTQLFVPGTHILSPGTQLFDGGNIWENHCEILSIIFLCISGFLLIWVLIVFPHRRVGAFRVSDACVCVGA